MVTGGYSYKYTSSSESKSDCIIFIENALMRIHVRNKAEKICSQKYFPR